MTKGLATLVIATANEGKRREFRELLAGQPLEIATLADFPALVLPEEGDDYAANALGKARTVARETGLVALGDDSGLEVDGLGGAPGPHSARYGGPGLDDRGRIDHLLSELARRSGAARRARFVCWIALAEPGGEHEIVQGVCEGDILPAPSGGGGFGYDPVFRPRGHAVSMAELPSAEKNRISHRARAVRALVQTTRWERCSAT